MTRGDSLDLRGEALVVMYGAKLAGYSGRCGIFWTLIPPESGLQPCLRRFFKLLYRYKNSVKPGRLAAQILGVLARSLTTLMRDARPTTDKLVPYFPTNWFNLAASKFSLRAASPGTQLGVDCPLESCSIACHSRAI